MPCTCETDGLVVVLMFLCQVSSVFVEYDDYCCAGRMLDEEEVREFREALFNSKTSCFKEGEQTAVE